MRYFFKLTGILFLTFAVFSCSGLTRKETSKWLNSKQGAPQREGEPRIDMTGKWDAGWAAFGGWGEGNFIQEGKKFFGSLGLYYVDGVVNGEDVYMAISSGDRIYYTAHLKKLADGTIAGRAVESAIIYKDESRAAANYVISLKKIDGPDSPDSQDREDSKDMKGSETI